MSFSPRPTRVDIDLEALGHNLRQVRSCCSQGQGVLAVIKADAYGHGAVAVGKKLEKEGVEYFGVATLEEAVELRVAGLQTPILVLGGCYPGQENEFLRRNLDVAVFSLEDLQRLEQFARGREERFRVHIKCDTGMGRVGFLPEEVSALIELLSGGRGIVVQGLMSHLARADEADPRVTQKQIRCFRKICQQFNAAGICPAAVHLSNSAGLVAWQVPECTLVRPGIILYGSYPAPEFRSKIDLQPVLTFSTRIAQLREIEPGSGISYGHTFHTERLTRLATLPVGYADGYNRLLSNCGVVLIRGQRVPVVGRVCMDWIMVDVTDVPEVAVGDRVVLLGRDGDQTITAEDWADMLGSISYEVFCRIGQRVPRHFSALPTT